MSSASSNAYLSRSCGLSSLEAGAPRPDLTQAAGDGLSFLPTESVCFEPILTYTRRRVGFVASCVTSSLQSDKRTWETVAPNDSRLFVEQLALQSADALQAFSVPLSYPPEKCWRDYPKGALLLLEAPSASWTQQSLLDHCKALTAMSFSVGVSSYCGNPSWNRALPLLSHIRIRHTASLPRHVRNLIAGPLRRKLFFIASGLEDGNSLASAMDTGFQLFQGSFLSHIPRLRWSSESFLSRATLLQRSCVDEAMFSVELLDDILCLESVSERFKTLLRSTGLQGAFATSSSSMLLAELGRAAAQRLSQLALAQDIADSSSEEFLRELFELARFHELMRGQFPSARSGWARLEGLLLGMFATTGCPSPEERIRSVAETLKTSVGIPLSCSALQRNIRIACAFRSADWPTACRLAKEDGIHWNTVNSLWHQSVVWSCLHTLACKPLLSA